MKIAQKIRLTAAIACWPLLAHAGAIEHLNDFLKNTRTLMAEFSQSVIGKNGRKPQNSSGTVAISRPGKLPFANDRKIDNAHLSAAAAAAQTKAGLTCNKKPPIIGGFLF